MYISVCKYIRLLITLVCIVVNIERECKKLHNRYN